MDRLTSAFHTAVSGFRITSRIFCGSSSPVLGIGSGVGGPGLVRRAMRKPSLGCFQAASLSISIIAYYLLEIGPTSPIDLAYFQSAVPGSDPGDPPGDQPGLGWFHPGAAVGFYSAGGAVNHHRASNYRCEVCCVDWSGGQCLRSHPLFWSRHRGDPSLVFALKADSPTKAMWVLGGFVVANQVESTVLGPRILSERVGLHQSCDLHVVLAGASLGGSWGCFWQSR